MAHRQKAVVRGTEAAFGRAVREVREARGVSQERLARAASLDRTYVSMIERGRRSPTIRVLMRIAEALQVRPSKIIAWMERMM